MSDEELLRMLIATAWRMNRFNPACVLLGIPAHLPGYRRLLMLEAGMRDPEIIEIARRYQTAWLN